MPPKTIELLENQRGSRKTSKYEIEMLGYMQKKTNKFIRTAFSHPDGQKRLKGYFVDGFIEADNVAIEFLGCHHGHVCAKGEKCSLNENILPTDKNHYGISFEEAYKRWEMKRKDLENFGMEVIFEWECVWKQKRETPEIKEFLKEFYSDGRPRERLALRNGLRGEFKIIIY